MDLAKLIVPSMTTKDEMPGYPGFFVEFAYLTRDELTKIRDIAKTNKVNRKSRAVEEEIDTDLFQKLYIQAVIKGWTGLKYKYLAKLLPVDLSEVEDVEDVLEYTPENAESLMKNCPTFDAWVTDVLDDVTNFTKSS